MWLYNLTMLIKRAFCFWYKCERQRTAVIPPTFSHWHSVVTISSGALHVTTASSQQGLSVLAICTATMVCAVLTTKFLLDFHIHSLFPFLVYINYHGLLFVRIRICEFNGTALLKITHTVNSSNLFMSNQSFFSPIYPSVSYHLY